MTILDLLKVISVVGFDISDNVWDWGNFFGCPTSKEECNDYYDKLMYLFASQIEVDGKYDPKWYTCCKISTFIDKYQKQFDKFMNEKNREDFAPKSYKQSFKFNEDEEWYDLYLNTFENLIIGNYSESDYEYLYNLLV